MLQWGCCALPNHERPGADVHFKLHNSDGNRLRIACAGVFFTRVAQLCSPCLQWRQWCSSTRSAHLANSHLFRVTVCQGIVAPIASLVGLCVVSQCASSGGRLTACLRWCCCCNVASSVTDANHPAPGHCWAIGSGAIWVHAVQWTAACVGPWRSLHPAAELCKTIAPDSLLSVETGPLSP